MPAKIGLPVCNGNFLCHNTHLLEEGGLGNVDRPWFALTDPLEILAPIKSRRTCGKFLQRHPVVCRVRVPLLDQRHRCFRKPRFYSHDGVRVLRRRCRVVTKKCEHLADVLKIVPPDFLGFIILLGVIVPVREAQSSLLQLRDHDIRVLCILVGVELENGIGNDDVLMSDNGHKISRSFDRGDPPKFIVQRLNPLLLPAYRVHRTGVKIADFLCGAPFGRVLLGRCFVHDLPQVAQILLIQFVEAAPPGVLGGYRVGGKPSPDGIAVEILRRIHRLVQILHIEAVNGRRRRDGRLGGESATCKNQHDRQSDCTIGSTAHGDGVRCSCETWVGGAKRSISPAGGVLWLYGEEGKMMQNLSELGEKKGPMGPSQGEEEGRSLRPSISSRKRTFQEARAIGTSP